MQLAAFLAAAPEDAALAAAIRAALAEQGLLVQLGADGGKLEAPGRLLSQAVSEARVLVLILSPQADVHEGVRRAAAAALANAKPIIPVLAADVRNESWLKRGIDQTMLVDARFIAPAEAAIKVAAAVKAAQKLGRVIAMLNIKGGVGKTMLAANLFTAAHLADERAVCFIDLDPQHNLTQYFLPPPARHRLRDENRTIYNVLVAEGKSAAVRAKFAELATPLNRTPMRPLTKPQLDLFAGDDRLFEYTLDTKLMREKEEGFARFHQLIATLRSRYDIVVIDTNPCATFLTRLAITAADHIAAPVRPERYSLAALGMLEWVTREIRERTVKPSEFSVILNGVGDRVRAATNDVDAMTRHEIGEAPFFGSALLKTAIPYSGLLRATPDERYAVNPINVAVVMRLAQRALKETLTAAAAELLARAAAP